MKKYLVLFILTGLFYTSIAKANTELNKDQILKILRKSANIKTKGRSKHKDVKKIHTKTKMVQKKKYAIIKEKNGSRNRGVTLYPSKKMKTKKYSMSGLILPANTVDEKTKIKQMYSSLPFGDLPNNNISNVTNNGLSLKDKFTMIAYPKEWERQQKEIKRNKIRSIKVIKSKKKKNSMDIHSKKISDKNILKILY